MSKRISKIKYKSDTVEIHIAEERGKEIIESVFTCTDKPHPDFESSLSSLEKTVREILELRSDWCPGLMKITGVTFSNSESTGVEGATITGSVKLENSNSPFCFNTPHLPFAQYSPTGTSPTMSMDSIKLIERLRAEANAYLDGSKRAQMKLL